MNLRNKLMMTVLLLGVLLGGCNLIYEDLSECPQGVYVRYYSKTPCAVDSTFLGAEGAQTVYLFAFDENNNLYNVVSENNVVLDRNYEMLVPLTKGSYTFIGWAGVDDTFLKGSFTKGKTTKSEVMLKLKKDKGFGLLPQTKKVWQGESDIVVMPAAEEVGSLYKHTAINLLEKTNRINVTVKIHESVKDKLDPKDFVVAISSANGTLNIDGTMPLGVDALKTVVNYKPFGTTYTDDSMKTSFTLMDLKTGYNNIISLVNAKTGQEFLGEKGLDLIGKILLGNNNPNVNLECDHDFNIELVIKDKCLDCGTYMCFAIYVNNWMVHSYETELGL
ncbi:Minor fimbrium anchoring subunit Mfa2 [Porphyromonas levii]|uniref:FimB/Mfa2 family fimbrial subunit n=1 Tax=Porphyromonas levii TaxID=28114 RepID=UPI001BA84BF2|nr:FimB/Mfa2 family fimbrial subunit [Porphyromonas levii]MBR8785633.1 Minor fimbrium anchoring subunit Mfa2 [Porphyromonas levii]